jgi:hypothetical protein
LKSRAIAQGRVWEMKSKCILNLVELTAGSIPICRECSWSVYIYMVIHPAFGPSWCFFPYCSLTLVHSTFVPSPDVFVLVPALSISSWRLAVPPLLCTADHVTLLQLMTKHRINRQFSSIVSILTSNWSMQPALSVDSRQSSQPSLPVDWIELFTSLL